MIANEYIASTLAQHLGFPVGKLQLAKVAGPDGNLQTGVVSKEVMAKEVITWKKAGKHVYLNPSKYIKRLGLMRHLIVFDAWIANIDRAAGKNLILYRKANGEKYNWYLIDHGHTLYGSPRKWKKRAWNAPFWKNIRKFYHTPRGLLRLQSSWAVLEPMVQKIEQLTDADIEAALESVPKGYLSPNKRQFIKRLLLTRKKHLRSMIKRWLASNGLKEYNKKA
ncbi:HipA family kinase [Paenibacillus alginolyticus]|uniref:HipA-like kinase domain-containing protein n=1 Tax=Paenibacillus alginolyticus TaxID=59839 RepID=A0ABT4GIW2_9BACL|nr:HipA family kinase [Paenibacillus alginolyticus]MCY9696131.1 hypothetical protein [Paenibacillus alginolyticus]MEC0143284.1 hypothetical protein [Paenibacillus alginolyticus]